MSTSLGLYPSDFLLAVTPGMSAVNATGDEVNGTGIVVMRLLGPGDRVTTVVGPGGDTPRSPVGVLTKYELCGEGPGVRPTDDGSVISVSEQTSAASVRTVAAEVVTRVPPREPSEPSVGFATLIVPVVRAGIAVGRVVPVSVMVPGNGQVASELAFPAAVGAVTTARSVTDL